MKLLVTSDWHMDWFTAGVPRFDDVDAAVRETVRVALAEKVDRYVFLGDLCDPDSMRSHRCVAYAIAVDRLLRESGVEAWWLTGNHDVIEDGTGTHVLTPLKATGAKVFDKPTHFPCEGHQFLVLPFTARSASYDPEMFVAECADHGGPTVVFGHLNIEGIGPGSETKDMPRGRDVFLPRHKIVERWPNALIFNGHYHERQVFEGVNIPGSLVRLTFGEERNKPGFLIAEV